MVSNQIEMEYLEADNDDSDYATATDYADALANFEKTDPRNRGLLQDQLKAIVKIIQAVYDFLSNCEATWREFFEDNLQPKVYDKIAKLETSHEEMSHSKGLFELTTNGSINMMQNNLKKDICTVNEKTAKLQTELVSIQQKLDAVQKEIANLVLWNSQTRNNQKDKMECQPMDSRPTEQVKEPEPEKKRFKKYVIKGLPVDNSEKDCSEFFRGQGLTCTMACRMLSKRSKKPIKMVLCDIVEPSAKILEISNVCGVDMKIEKYSRKKWQGKKPQEPEKKTGNKARLKGSKKSQSEGSISARTSQWPCGKKIQKRSPDWVTDC